MSKGSKKDVNKGIRALLSNVNKSNSSGGKVESELTKSSSETTVTAIDSIPISQIVANPFQPRTKFDDNELKELGISIKTHGIIQPITVRRLSEKKYQIISGERRWRASKKAKLKDIPAYIREADDQTLLEMALLENIQRSDLNPIEIAISYQRLIDECDLTHEQMSDRLGKSRSSITNHLRLLKLAPAVQSALRSGDISLGHAKVLAGVELIEKQTLLLGEIISKDLSVRATEALLREDRKTRGKSTRDKDPNLKKMEDELSDALGTRVMIKRSKDGKGSLHIGFTSDRELNDLFDSLLDV